MSNYFNKLFIGDVANNHCGDVNHGKHIIQGFYTATKEFNEEFKFAIKFQYRQLDTFISPRFKGNHDYKYIKRFEETRLSTGDFIELKQIAESLGLLTVCTAFDEESVDVIVDQGFNIIKVASCSFKDWPLWEKVVETDLPIIASIAGADISDITKVVEYLDNRDKDYCLMHCIAEYPTIAKNLELNQIDFLRKNFYNLPIGYSTHEDPCNLSAIQIAIGKGAETFERHIDNYSVDYNINKYSSYPEIINAWVRSAKEAYDMCGIKDERYKILNEEKESLHGLKRGVWVKNKKKKGEILKKEDVFYAIPLIVKDHLVADDISKYKQYTLTTDLTKNQAVCHADVNVLNIRKDVLDIINNVKKMMIKSKIVIPSEIKMELSHHYGIEDFYNNGAVILTYINDDEYAKKILIMFSDQKHPFHFHKKKKETFNVIYGSMDVILKVPNGSECKSLKKGDILTIIRTENHSFYTKTGCVFEEISTKHYADDSYYEDTTIMGNKDGRKTKILFRNNWLNKKLK